MPLPPPIICCDSFAGILISTGVPEACTSGVACTGVAEPLQSTGQPVGWAFGLPRGWATLPSCTWDGDCVLCHARWHQPLHMHKEEVGKEGLLQCQSRACQQPPCVHP